ncbi:MAG: NAD(P)-dependent oxidoreductase [Caldilineaceae bacterium]
MTEQATNPKRVLVTGSTGAIGEPVCERLMARGHFVRGFAQRPSPVAHEFVQGDLNDRDKVYEAVKGMDVVIHLGAYPNPADFIDVLLQPNVVGLYYICEAAKDLGVQRLVLASTMQTVSGHGWEERKVTIEEGPAPVNHYADQGLGRGSGRDVRPCPQPVGDQRAHRLAAPQRRRSRTAQQPILGPDTFFSHRDAQLFHQLCVESPNPGPGEAVTLFATSRPKYIERMDLEPARRPRL